MSSTTKLYGVALDCPDPAKLASFYSELTGLKVGYTSDSYVGLDGDGGPAIGFQQVADYRAPDWPGQEVPQQFHLDFAVDDLDAAQGKALGLGAVVAQTQPGGDRWRVLLDPAGHPFCLVTM
jgi:catechol 2,3-dioxygenase-like lactoylglutathione lyase family enzyme